MTKQLQGRWLFLLAIIMIWSTSAGAARFDPLFKITKITGECTVKPKGKSAYEPAEQGKAYPYGTALKTGKKSSAVIRFSLDNTCRVLADASIVLVQGVKNRKLKKIKLNSGSVDVQLEDNFHTQNKDDLHVETATAICAAIGCRFEVHQRNENDLRITVIKCLEGEIKVIGSHFEIPLLKKDNWVSLSASRDMRFTRVKNGGGRYHITYRDTRGEERKIPFNTGASIKIWRRPSEDGKSIIISLLVIAPDGTMIDAVSLVEKLNEDEDEDLPDPNEILSDNDDGNPPDQKKKHEKEVPGDWEIIARATTTTTTTTTTTLSEEDEAALFQTTTTTKPSPTPVGRR